MGDEWQDTAASAPHRIGAVSDTVQKPYLHTLVFLTNRTKALVPRCHFNVLDGTAYIDETGVELAGIDEAKREARRYAGTMLAESAKVSTPDREWSVEVTDHKGLGLFRLGVSMIDML